MSLSEITLRILQKNEENRFRFGTWNKLSYWLMRSTLHDARC